jgi:hypothetical protein
MINDSELEKMQKGAVMIRFIVVSQHFPGGTEANHKISQSEYPVSVPVL